VSLTVRDDGRGFDAGPLLEGTSQGEGLGLRGMRDRVSLYGGKVDVRSSPGHGTAIAVEVPVSVASGGEVSE
jgi:signal transduction histidine kinase